MLEPVRLGNPVKNDDNGLYEDAEDNSDERLKAMRSTYTRKLAPHFKGKVWRRIGTPYGI